MEPTITPEHSDSPDATALIGELDAHLEPLYPRESRHGFSVQKLIADSVAFFVVRDDGAAVGCGGIKLFGTEYADLAIMLNDARGWAKGTLPTYQDRKEFFESIVNGDPDPIALLREGLSDAVLEIIQSAQRVHQPA